MQPARGLVDWVARLSHFLFPRDCLLCGAPCGPDPLFDLCGSCRGALPAAGPHACRRCALPIEGELAGAGILLCGDCRTDPPAFDAAVAPLRYEGKGRELIHRFKFNGKARLAGLLGPLLCAALHRGGIMEGVAMIVPVPLHRRRLFARGYNQSYLLAAQAGAAFGLPVETELLERARHSPPQFSLSRAERRKNMRGVFALARPEAVAGRGVLLVDDVMTTGATLDEAARTLKKGGAARVVCAVAARTL